MESLRVLLARRKLTMRELEAKTDVRQPTIRKIMDGIPIDVRVSTLQQIAKGLPGVKLVIGFEESGE